MLSFDPDRIAHYEAAGWRAYYDRDWWRLLRMTVALCQARFGIPFPYAWLAAYHVVRASIAWVPVQNDHDVVQAHLARFYRLAARYSGLGFDPKQAARWELEYWAAHRRLVGQADKSEFIEALTQLHSTLFRLTPLQARESAEWRVMANNVVDLITSRQSTDVAADWARLEEHLRHCYRSLERAMHPMRAAPTT